MNNKKVFIILAVIGCLVFNYVAQTGGPLILLLAGQVLFFFSLYKILVLEGENGWYAVFGILNVLGLAIVLLIPRFKSRNNHHLVTFKKQKLLR